MAVAWAEMSGAFREVPGSMPGVLVEHRPYLSKRRRLAGNVLVEGPRGRPCALRVIAPARTRAVAPIPPAAIVARLPRRSMGTLTQDAVEVGRLAASTPISISIRRIRMPGLDVTARQFRADAGSHLGAHLPGFVVTPAPGIRQPGRASVNVRQTRPLIVSRLTSTPSRCRRISSPYEDIGQDQRMHHGVGHRRDAVHGQVVGASRLARSARRRCPAPP